MNMEPKKLETMDDVRAAMNDPEVQAANKAFSKKYLKANRPKSLAVVIFSIAAIFLIMSLSGHKASSVTPVLLRTAETVTVGRGSDHAGTPLTQEQRDALLELLGSVKVKRTDRDPDEFLLAGDYYFFRMEPDGGDGENWFAVDETGSLYVTNHCYEPADGGANLWSRLEALCGAAQ